MAKLGANVQTINAQLFAAKVDNPPLFITLQTLIAHKMEGIRVQRLNSISHFWLPATPFV